MKIKHLIKRLQKFDGERQLYISTDEELNHVYKKISFNTFPDKTVIIYGVGLECEF